MSKFDQTPEAQNPCANSPVSFDNLLSCLAGVVYKLALSVIGAIIALFCVKHIMPRIDKFLTDLQQNPRAATMPILVISMIVAFFGLQGIGKP